MAARAEPAEGKVSHVRHYVPQSDADPTPLSINEDHSKSSGRDFIVDARNKTWPQPPHLAIGSSARTPKVIIMFLPAIFFLNLFEIVIHFSFGETTQHAQRMMTAAPSSGPVTRILVLCQWFPLLLNQAIELLKDVPVSDPEYGKILNRFGMKASMSRKDDHSKNKR
jgi:hypothetical protein